LSCPWFVLSMVCLVYGLACLWFVFSMVCLVYGLSCLWFICSGFVYLEFVTPGMHAQNLAIQLSRDCMSIVSLSGVCLFGGCLSCVCLSMA
jgi:hypothetical protein